MYVRIDKTLTGKLKELSNISHKEPGFFVQEAINFYFAYLDFLGLEKKACIVMEAIGKKENKEEAIKEADLILQACFRHFSKDLFIKYVETKEKLGDPAPVIPDNFMLIPNQESE